MMGVSGDNEGGNIVFFFVLFCVIFIAKLEHLNQSHGEYAWFRLGFYKDKAI